jgi:hypothetical protein
MAHKHTFHRRNPSVKGDLGTIAIVSVGSIAGAAGSRIVPYLLGSTVDVGAVGYLMNLATTFGLWWLARGIPNIAMGIAIGGVTSTAIRAINDNILPNSGLGAYWPSFFAVPTVSNPVGQVLQSPYPARVA